MDKTQNADNTRAGTDAEQQERLSTTGGGAKGAATVEDSLVQWFLTKLNILFCNVQSNNHNPWYLPKVTENLHPHKTLHINVYSSFIRNCQTKATKMSFRR